MAKWPKRGADVEVSKNAAKEVCEAVEHILLDIERRGDAAVRELAVMFDEVDRDD
ncbi:histidinol dehydrogenase [Trinickia mobilis]|uniref:histidinol dehydrogenase n=1 Tax=Trinickia mobilis TaxID=2816356 RepID=UPI001A8C95BC|nr:histidinol dehydrogenase [Trinickia mobilis]